MGNRGCLHDDRGDIVRPHHGKAWISCTTTWPGIRRTLMAPGAYTELFFLDEATALAAGHRPCSQCRRDAAAAFKRAWHDAFGGSWTVRAMDDHLAAERQSAPEPIDRTASIAEGAMAGEGSSAWLRWHDHWWAWSFAGYRISTLPDGALLLTRPSMLAVLEHGYAPLVHPSAAMVTLRLDEPGHAP